MMKIGKTKLTVSLTNLFNSIITCEQIPSQWKESTIILIHKKGDKGNVNNYRPISLISTIYKVFSKCIFRRIRKTLDEQQPREQAGFRSGFSTTDHLQTINQIIEKSKEYQQDIHIAFIDFMKAFDTIEHDMIWQALKNQGLPTKIIRIIRNLYTNSTARISLEFTGMPFKLERGVRQGDPLSPAIFCAVLEEIFRELNWETLGLKVDGEYLNNLRFADDVALFATSTNDLSKMIKDLEKSCTKAGLKMNADKTKLMSKGEQTGIFIYNKQIEYVEDYIYLGQLISL